ncbi:MAG: hypothetical protein U0R77_05780 [Mycolicibacterium insubricum]|nr:hypothetical protein [Mycobacterium sp.]
MSESETETPTEHLTLAGMARLCEFWPQDRPVVIMRSDGTVAPVVYACHETATVDGQQSVALVLCDHWPYGDGPDDA